MPIEPHGTKAERQRVTRRTQPHKGRKEQAMYRPGRRIRRW